MDQIPVGMLAQADREVCDLRERIGHLVNSYRVLRAGDDAYDATTAVSWVTAQINGSVFSRMDLSGLMAVAVSMLAEPKAGE